MSPPRTITAAAVTAATSAAVTAASVRPSVAAATPAGGSVHTLAAGVSSARSAPPGRPWRQDAQVLYRESNVRITVKTPQLSLAGSEGWNPL
ncbi:hypothetical protein ACFPIJ_16205 [Dactylosporangium cerinum]|uniref:Uncharacterized protein n=1 Tax=Dactylosporangium cerinum TaxID=1434730 RepID=A0ABV9VVD9_9ACTN